MRDGLMQILFHSAPLGAGGSQATEVNASCYEPGRLFDCNKL